MKGSIFMRIYGQRKKRTPLPAGCYRVERGDPRHTGIKKILNQLYAIHIDFKSRLISLQTGGQEIPLYYRTPDMSPYAHDRGVQEGTLHQSHTVTVFFVLTLVVGGISGYYLFVMADPLSPGLSSPLTASAAEVDDCIRIIYSGGAGEDGVEAITWTFRNTRDERLDGREERPKPGFTYMSPPGATEGPDSVVVTAVFSDGRREVILDTVV